MNGPVADLTLVEQFLNTDDQRTFRRHGERRVAGDELTSVEALSGWLTARHLIGEGQRLTRSDLDAAVRLRTALRATLAGEDHSLAEFPLTLAPDRSGRLHLRADSGVPGLDPVVESVAVGVADGSWRRLKLCAADDCRWAFYDSSRNGKGRWCSMEVCGNRSKTSAYRRRTG
ncbi:CGNR zinc finger domain-containing protein [Lentzea sp. NPDC060358]|uniref:CGNR zinc finger domain-containing protein n=1 Tax=Lentzea sp. NPDC060358 TaxID=3347103 RepID=UPI0036577AC7